MGCNLRVLLLLGSVAGLASPATAETVMQQCSGQYQAAKAAGTLNGMSWNQFRTDCAAKLKAQPASATAPAAPAATPATQTANPLNPAPAPAATAATPAAVSAATAATTPAATAAAAPAGAAKPMSPGRAAFQAREKQCGAEWRANKAALTAQTPGLKWPQYLSQCNARLKAAGK